MLGEQVRSVNNPSMCRVEVSENGHMLGTLVIALLVWLWIIERRLGNLRSSVRSLKLDVDGVRAMRAQASPSLEPTEPPKLAPIHDRAKGAVAR